MWYIIGILGVLLGGFVWRRFTSVQRGIDARDARIVARLQPVEDRLRSGIAANTSEVALLAASPENRPLLHALLKHYEQLSFFPKEHLTVEAQAKANLSYWMMHPNELGDPPVEIEVVETITRSLDGIDGDFVVLRYLMGAEHWASKDGWMLGLSGPFISSEPPYSGVANGFARCSDKCGRVAPEELVDWYIGVAYGRRAEPSSRAGG